LKKLNHLKQFAFLLLVLIFFSACKSTSPISTSKKTETSSSKKKQLNEQLIHSAAENIGVRYKLAGTTKAGFDCSGLVYSTYNSYEIKVPRTSLEQSKSGIIIKRDAAQKGDLIFFKTNNSRQINHVGIITEIIDDEIKFIHSSTSRGVIISSTKESYYQKSYAQINRVLE
jgi:lipoprotein Spr